MSPLALSLRFLQAQPDSRLVALAREGHEPAFEALVRRYRGELFAYCRRLQPQSSSAEDALQQALLQAWKALSAGAEVREVRPWLYRIAHNVSLNSLRRMVAVAQETGEADGGPDVAQLVEQRMRARAALAGVAALPTLQRQVFVSTTLDGASHEEVASTLGLSSGAIRGLVYRARATVRAAAAAVTPSPFLHWALRRAESRTGVSPGVVEALAGGSGAGVAAVLVKGGAVLTLAGAVAGGGVILSHRSEHRRHHQERLEHRSLSRQLSPGVGRSGLAAAALVLRAEGGLGAENRARHDGRPPGSRSGGGDSGRDRHAGSSRGGSGGGSGDSRSGASGSSDDGSGSGATVSGSGTGSRDGGGSDGGTSGGSTSTTSGSDGGTSGGSTSTTSGSDGGTSGGSTTTTSGSDGGTSGGSTATTSGSDGGGGSSGTSGGGQVTTTSSDGGMSSGGSSGSGGTGSTTATT